LVGINYSIFGQHFTNFSAAAILLTLQIVKSCKKEEFDEVRRVGVVILRAQLQKPEIEVCSLRRNNLATEWLNEAVPVEKVRKEITLSRTMYRLIFKESFFIV
jgi:hypothetical protein